MKTQRRLISSVICALALVSNLAVVGSAQEKGAKTQTDVVVQNQVFVDGDPQEEGLRMPFEMMAPPGLGDTFMFVSSEMSLDGKVVKGAPYSAQAVTMHTQTLADGNRIMHKSLAAVYRDSEGRTRREQSIALGAYTSSGTPRQTVFINDPVANVNYILELDTKIARKVDLSRLPGRREFGSARGGERGQRVEIVTGDKVPGGAASSVAITTHSHTTGRADKDANNVKTESLGKQTIEGVVADGTRTTRTIPAGEIGNEQPINMVSESWYSAELQKVVMSKHSDPLHGESSYHLTNINRSEPAASLFQVPSDYSVKEAMPPGMRIKVDSEMRRPRNDQ